MGRQAAPAGPSWGQIPCLHSPALQGGGLWSVCPEPVQREGVAPRHLAHEEVTSLPEPLSVHSALPRLRRLQLLRWVPGVLSMEAAGRQSVAWELARRVWAHGELSCAKGHCPGPPL